MAEATNLGRNVIVMSAYGFDGVATTETAIGRTVLSGSPDATGTAVIATYVPADGAELIAASYIVTSAGTVTTSGNHAWAISDGTNTLATASFSATSTLNTVVAFTTATATNGKAIATTTGARLILTNTETGTIGDGIHGIFRFVWGL